MAGIIVLGILAAYMCITTFIRRRNENKLWKQLMDIRKEEMNDD